MGLGDKISNQGQEAAGKAKDSVHGADNNETQPTQSAADESAARAKETGEDIKDAAQEAKDK